jgi:hypothetical protein
MVTYLSLEDSDAMSKPGKSDQGLDALSYDQLLEQHGLVISPKKLTRVLTLVVIGLVLCHIASHLVVYITGGQVSPVREFDLDQENNLPTWYSSLALLLCAILLGIIGHQKNQAAAPSAGYWKTMALVFLFLATDEAASIHEILVSRLYPFLKPYNFVDGWLFASWVIFGAIGVLMFFTVNRRFLATLPVQTRYLFLLAGTLYVGGSLGVEIIGSRYGYLYGRENLSYAMLVACEEGFEMIGIVVFIYALTSHLESLRAGVQIFFSDGGLRKTPTNLPLKLRQRGRIVSIRG